MMFFVSSSCRHLGSSLRRAGAKTVSVRQGNYADGEPWYQVPVSRLRSGAVLASVLPEPASLVDLIGAYTAVRDQMNRSPFLVLPYFGFARQDKITPTGAGALGVTMAQVIASLSPKKIIAVDLHSDQIRRAFGSRLHEISALPLIADHFRAHTPDVIVAPDHGAKKRAQQLAKLLGAKTAFVDKIRPRAGVAKAVSFKGNVQGKRVLIIDDMIDTGGTILETVKVLKKNKAALIDVAATHGLFSRGARGRLFRSSINQLVITNTLPQPRHRGLKVLDVGKLLSHLQ